jgi:lipopolysaccharide biosynthesis glycosyltransferase
MDLIYSCVFFQDKYIDLISLLLKSYIVYGKSNTKYLIITNESFVSKIQNIFDTLNINGTIWSLNLNSKFEAGYSRLKIFDYPEINNYNKILYLDCDVLIGNKVENILNLILEDKLYGLKEGNTNHLHWGAQFFENNPNISGFTSGVLLFNNSPLMKNLFQNILTHIETHINNNLPIDRKSTV